MGRIKQHEIRAVITETVVGGENPLLGTETLKRIHRYMVHCRAFAERAARARRKSKTGAGPAIGLEAVEVGTIIHLQPGDMIAPLGSRWISRQLAESPLEQMIRELFPELGEQSSPAIITDKCMGSGLAAIATGVALGHKRQHIPAVVVVFSDRASLGQAATDEAMALAGEQKLPVIYVVENNVWEAIGSVNGRGSDDELHVRALHYGFPAMPVDGNDAIAVYRVAQEAIARARKNGGPTLIECQTFRWFGHPAIDPARTRPATEAARWLAKDPIVHMNAYLKKKGLSPE